jgi:transcription initiation factor TFIIIB Brf1 subunit/transcription initiation factor TFIIB
MRKNKDLNVCISSLEDLQRRGSVDSEQRQAVEHVVNELKRIRRKPSLERHEQHESIRKIVEELVRAFKKRD